MKKFFTGWLLLAILILPVFLAICMLRNNILETKLEQNWSLYNKKKYLPFGFEWVEAEEGNRHVGFYNWPLGPYHYRDKDTGERWGSE